MGEEEKKELEKAKEPEQKEPEQKEPEPKETEPKEPEQKKPEHMEKETKESAAKEEVVPKKETEPAKKEEKPPEKPIQAGVEKAQVTADNAPGMPGGVSEVLAPPHKEGRESGDPKDRPLTQAVSGPVKPTNCVQCNKPLKRGMWYYRNGKFYCNKRCWKKSTEKVA